MSPVNKKQAQQIKRIELEDSLRKSFEATLCQRIDRCLEVEHQKIIGNHYFSRASAECLDLYRDGYFISTVMTTQAVNEGIIKFIAEKNNEDGEHRELIDIFESKSIFSPACAEASKKIWRSFRNDIHHMNPKVSSIPFPEVAQKNIMRLAIMESEIFGVDIENGKLRPHQPQYWDINADGTVEVYLRFT